LTTDAVEPPRLSYDVVLKDEDVGRANIDARRQRVCVIDDTLRVCTAFVGGESGRSLVPTLPDGIGSGVGFVEVDWPSTLTTKAADNLVDEKRSDQRVVRRMLLFSVVIRISLESDDEVDLTAVSRRERL
jgi:hypothetical protein